MSLLRHPRLPEGEATHVLASGEFPWLAEALERRGVTVVATQRDSRLPGPVQFHPDLQTCPLPDKQMFVLKNSPLQPALKALGFSLRETQCEPSGTYPGDALCGCFPWGPWLVGNPKAIDRAIAQEAQKQGLQPLPVRQGYSACSVALVDGESAITADQGMFQALRTKGFAVLLIRPGHIALPGYDTGFIGGCCGKLAPDKLAFAGALSSHPDGERMREFLHSRCVAPVELRESPLVDVGGILPLRER